MPPDDPRPDSDDPHRKREKPPQRDDSDESEGDERPRRDVHRGTTDADETLDEEGYQAFD